MPQPVSKETVLPGVTAVPWGFPEWKSWELKWLHFFFHKSGSSPHISACADPVLWVSARWGQATEQEGNSPLQTRYQLLIWVLPADLGVGFGAVQLLIHVICLFEAVVGIQGGVPCFFPAKYYGMDWFLQFPTPKQQMKLFVTWSMKSIIVNRENIFSWILGNAIAIELVIAACESHSGGILSLTPLYIWSKNAFSLSLCSTR